MMRQGEDVDGKVDKLEFSYNLGDQLKIDIQEAKKKQREKQKKADQSKKEFEELKKQMESSNNNAMPKVTPKQLTNTKFRPDIEKDNGSDGSKKS